jgi:hypothetical protein
MNARRLASSLSVMLTDLGAGSGMRFRVSDGGRTGADLVVRMDAGGERRARAVVVLCANARTAQVMHAAERAQHAARPSKAIPTVALPTVSERLCGILRQLGVGYLGLDGRVFLSGAGIHIDRDVGTRNRVLQKPASASLFADKSSVFVRRLLQDGTLSGGVRRLAAELGVSAGLASRLLARLKDEGFVAEGEDGLRVADAAGLLDEWRVDYQRRARRQVERRMYLHAPDVATVMHQLASAAGRAGLPPWGLSFHAGASLVAAYAFFSEVHVLLGGDLWEQSAERFGRELGLVPATTDANVILVQPCYARSWSHGLRRISGLPVVSDVQLFLDLSVYPRRGAEQAERMREHVLAALQERKAP